MKEIPDIAISAEKVGAIVAIARRFGVKDVIPPLGDYFEEALARLGHSSEEFEQPL
jgi:hypothetical protein